MSVLLFWVMMLCGIVGRYQCFGGGDMFLWNIGIYLRVHTVSQPRRTSVWMKLVMELNSDFNSKEHCFNTAEGQQLFFILVNIHFFKKLLDKSCRSTLDYILCDYPFLVWRAIFEETDQSVVWISREVSVIFYQHEPC
jgi:hypothetical protein